MKRTLLLALLVAGSWFFVPGQVWASPTPQQYSHDSLNEGSGDDDEPDITIRRSPEVKVVQAPPSGIPEPSEVVRGSVPRSATQLAALVTWARNLIHLITRRR